MNLPVIGKTYFSKLDPDIKILVTDFQPVELDPINNVQIGFFVEGCATLDKYNINAICYEFTQDEWIEHDFIPLVSP